MSIKSGKIAIWGDQDSGKTSYLVGLKAIGDSSSTWDITFTSNPNFLQDVENFKEKGIFPPGTEPQSILDYTFTIRNSFSFSFLFIKRSLRYKKGFSFDTIDIGGDATQDDKLEKHSEFLSFTSEVSGILLFINPQKRSKNRGKINLDNKPIKALHDHIKNTRKLGSYKVLRPNIAICVTKMDLDDHWEWIDNTEQYLEKYLLSDTYKSIKNLDSIAKVRHFGLSTAGRYKPPNDKIERPNVISLPIIGNERYRIASPENWKPVNLEDPLLWIANEFAEK